MGSTLFDGDLHAADATGPSETPQDGTPQPSSPVQAGTTTNTGTSNAPASFSVSVQRARLDNGLRVVVRENRGSKTVAVCVTYDVGSRNEPDGHGGFAQLFEQIMFQGSRNVGQGDHFRLIAGRGGHATAMTDTDRTSFVSAGPRSELDLMLWLEAERMGTLAITRDTFETQRQVALENYRHEVTNPAYGEGYIRLRRLVFQGFWPYEHSPQGTLPELEQAQFDWVRAFHRQYYAPNNAVLTISGDVDAATALELVTRHFGVLPSRPTPIFDVPTQLPRQTSERLNVATHVSAKTPAAYHGWRIPPAHHEDRYALDLAALVLAQGESSRLFQSLVRQRAAVLGVQAGTEGPREAGIFFLSFQVTPLSSVDKAQEALDGELKRLRFIGPSQAELDKAKNQLRLSFLQRLEANDSAARWLAEQEMFWGDAADLLTELGKYDAVEIADVRRTAMKYLTEDLRSIVEIYPPGWIKDEAPEIIQRTHIVTAGENLTSIALRYGSTVRDITVANNISRSAPLHPGQKLRVPVVGKPAKELRRHTIKAGENLGTIARRYKTTVAAIAAANGLNPKSPIQPGVELRIPEPVSVAEKEAPDTPPRGKQPAPGSKEDAPPLRSHTVRKGENLGVIAQRYKTSVAAISKLNGLNPKSPIRPGAVLKIPATPGASTGPAPKRKK